jgi:hypothetical protein
MNKKYLVSYEYDSRKTKRRPWTSRILFCEVLPSYKVIPSLEYTYHHH